MSDDSTNHAMTKEAPSLADFVSQRIGYIQNRYLPIATRPSVAGVLASLRHAVGNPVGADLGVWLFEFTDFPKRFSGYGDKPSTAEQAAHLAFTLYAVHQQSQSIRMHKSGREYGLGQAVARLNRQQRDAGANDPMGKLPSRFAALGTATDFDEISHYARQIITQLRSADQPIPLDYGRLATQFDKLLHPSQAAGVRLAWGREFAGFRDDDTTSTTKQKEQ